MYQKLIKNSEIHFKFKSGMNPNDRLGFILGESRGKEKKAGRSLGSVLLLGL
jgi:hypothetical protein